MSTRAVRLLAGVTLLVGAVAAAPVPLEISAPSVAIVDDTLAEDLAALSGGARALAYIHGRDWREVEDAVAATTAVPVTRFREVAVVAAAVTASDVAALQADARIDFLEGEVEVTRHTNTSLEAIRADDARTMLGSGASLTGEGTAVAVLDTGVDADHPMFLVEGAETPDNRDDDVTKVLRQLKWVCGIAPWNLENDAGSDLSDTCLLDVSSTGGTKNDTLEQGGHGTHVASTAAGLPWTTADGRELSGVAPGATILDIAVEQGATFLGANNGMAFVLRHIRSWCDPSAPATRVWEGQTDVDAGCDPIVVTNHSYGPRGGGPYAENSIANKLARKLVERGVTVSWSAGNDGDPGDKDVDLTNPTPKDPTPGILMVANYDDGGAGTREGSISTTSSRGAKNDPATWPDIAAPGSNITAACAPTLPICRGSELGDLYAGTISGTSMAAPHVAGAVAILQQAALVTGTGTAGGGLALPGDVERLLKQSAHPFGDASAYTEPNSAFRADHFGVAHAYDRGVGLLDVAAAVSLLTGAPQPEDGIDLSALPGGPQITDPAGDAGILVSNEWTYAGAYDLTSVRVSTAQGGVGDGLGSVGDVVVEWTVVDIDDRPTSVDGETWEWDFSVNGVAYSVEVNRQNDVGALAFADSATLVTPAGNVSLPFEFDGNVIRAVLPADQLRTMFGTPDLEGVAFTSMAAYADARFGVLLLRGDILTGMGDFVYGSDDNTVIAVEPAVVTEDQPSAIFELTLNEPRYDVVTVDVALVDGSGTAGQDASLVPQTIEFAPGTTRATVAVDILDDAAEEDDETLQLVLSNPRQATLATASTTLTIIDDDQPDAPPTIDSFDPAAEAVLEGSGDNTAVSFTVVLDRITDRDVPISIDVVGGAANLGIDFLAPAATVVVPAGADHVSFDLLVIGDRRPEADEAVVLRATPAVGPSADATLMILDDDGRNRGRMQ